MTGGQARCGSSAGTVGIAPRGWTRRRWVAVALLALGAALVTQTPAPVLQPEQHGRAMLAAELRQRFDQAVLMLHARQYEHAATALHRVLQLSPRMPEGHINMGFAMLGLQRGAEAAAAFERAIDLQPRKANAYYGLAMAQEQLGDLEAALGAMRSYLHLAGPDERHRAKARAALWEWEDRLGRHRPVGTGAASQGAPSLNASKASNTGPDISARR